MPTNNGDMSQLEAVPTPQIAESDASVEATLSAEPTESSGEATEAATLTQRIIQLERELAEERVAVRRMMEECGEFSSCFPDVSLQSVPEDVWNRVREGVPLAAAYALYEKKRNSQRAQADARNQQNAAQSSGVICGGDARYFSPAEVRAMSRGEIRQNYDRIFESMRHWQ